MIFPFTCPLSIPKVTSRLSTPRSASQRFPLVYQDECIEGTSASILRLKVVDCCARQQGIGLAFHWLLTLNRPACPSGSPPSGSPIRLH